MSAQKKPKQKCHSILITQHSALSTFPKLSNQQSAISTLFFKLSTLYSSLSTFPKLIILLIMGILFCFSYNCSAQHVWPETTDPNGRPVTEDRIGYENENYI